jgi:hypothetical protein
VYPHVRKRVDKFSLWRTSIDAEDLDHLQCWPQSRGGGDFKPSLAGSAGPQPLVEESPRCRSVLAAMPGVLYVRSCGGRGLPLKTGCTIEQEIETNPISEYGPSLVGHAECKLTGPDCFPGISF